MFYIINNQTPVGEGCLHHAPPSVEYHSALESALHALKVINDHEERHGRGKDYYRMEKWVCADMCWVRIPNTAHIVATT